MQENYNDSLEYVNNMKQLGVNEEIASYQARFTDKLINRSVDSKVDVAISKLNLDRFATKEDIYKLDNKIDALCYDLEKQINETKASIQHLEYRMDNKMFKHTALIITIILLTNIPTPIKNLLLNILHIQ